MAEMRLRDIDDNLYRRYKALCVLKGEGVEEQAKELIEQWVKKQEKK